MTIAPLLSSAEIDAIWQSLDPALDIDDTQSQLIAQTANIGHATVLCIEDRERPAAAHKVLTNECTAQRQKMEARARMFLGPLMRPGKERQLHSLEMRQLRHFFDPRILLLEAGLRATRALFAPRPPRERQWKVVAQMIWQEAERALLAIGRPGGTSQKSLAVRFTATLLARIGYPEATPDAVAKVAKQFSRERTQGAASQATR